MTDFHEIRFPSDISFKAQGGQEFSTSVNLMTSGFEKRNINNSLPRAKYEIDFKNISPSQAEKLRDFFIARQGQAYGFRFKDWQDFQAKNQILGTGNGIKTQFQIIKKYGDEIYEIEKKITKIISGSVSVYLNSVPQSSGFSVEYNSGIITFSSPPANFVLVSCDFEFDVPVRFASDSLSYSVESFSRTSMSKIELVEVRV